MCVRGQHFVEAQQGKFTAPEPDPGVVDGCRRRLSFGRCIENCFSGALCPLDSQACTHSAETTWIPAVQTCSAGRQQLLMGDDYASARCGNREQPVP